MGVADELLAAVVADPTRENCAVYADHLVELGELANLDLALEAGADPALTARRDQRLETHGESWWPGLVPGERLDGSSAAARQPCGHGRADASARSSGWRSWRSSCPPSAPGGSPNGARCSRRCAR